MESALGHSNYLSISQLRQSGSVIGLDRLTTSSGPKSCEAFQRGKHTHQYLHRNPVRAQAVGDVIHSDVFGPMSQASLGSYRYYVSFIDEYSCFIRISPITRKSQVKETFEWYLAWTERKYNCKIKRLHSGNGGEYVSLEPFLSQRGIEVSRSPPYSPEQNGIAERANRTIIETARSMLAHAYLPCIFWAEAVSNAADICNRFFSPRQGTAISYELLYRKKPRVDHIRVFGCRGWLHVPPERRRTLDSKAEEGLLMVSYDNHQYKIWVRATNQAVVSRHASLFETEFPGREWFSETNSGMFID